MCVCVEVGRWESVRHPVAVRSDVTPSGGAQTTYIDCWFTPLNVNPHKPEGLLIGLCVLG